MGLQTLGYVWGLEERVVEAAAFGVHIWGEELGEHKRKISPNGLLWYLLLPNKREKQMLQVKE